MLAHSDAALALARGPWRRRARGQRVWIIATGTLGGASGKWLLRVETDGALTQFAVEAPPARELSFSPGGSSLVSVVRPTPDTLPELFAIDLSGPAPSAPTKANRALPGGSQISAPVWSPARDHLAYLEINYDNTRNDLYHRP